MHLASTPWPDDSELALVRDWFYPQHEQRDVYSTPSGDQRQRAIDKVNLWLFKTGSIPHALVATASLTAAVLHDEQIHRREHITDSAMQSIYAMAICRFVNGFVDRDVAKSKTAALLAVDSNMIWDEKADAIAASGKGESSMYAHAAKIGMPAAFVDLRHQVTHGEMPSLFHLHEMTTRALEWLWSKWWCKNVTGDSFTARQRLEAKQQAFERRQLLWPEADFRANDSHHNMEYG